MTFNPCAENCIRNAGSRWKNVTFWRRSAGIEKRVACHPRKYLPKMPDIAPKLILERRREMPDGCADFMWRVNVDGCIN